MIRNGTADPATRAMCSSGFTVFDATGHGRSKKRDGLATAPSCLPMHAQQQLRNSSCRIDCRKCECVEKPKAHKGIEVAFVGDNVVPKTKTTNVPGARKSATLKNTLKDCNCRGFERHTTCTEAEVQGRAGR